jgi:erythromycin esterase-like protein
MRRLVKSLPLLALSLAISLSLGGRQFSRTEAPAIHPIDSKNYTDPNQFAFLNSTLNGVEVVSLGESIHLTHEFPLVRLGIIRYLNEKMGFHVLAMEGSAEDIWVAQDRFLNSPHTSEDAADSQQGLFGLWNTPEVRQLFEYEAASWSSANPFYVTAYDIQPGSGSNSHGAEVFRMLSERLKGYVAAPQGMDVAKLMGDLTFLTHGCNDYQAGDQPRVEKAIQDLQKWIDTAAPEVQKRFPNVPHSTALSLIPENLHASLQLCKDYSADNRNNYKAHRDTNAAPFALELKAAVPGQKLILWAHVSHIFHNAEHAATSVGEILHGTLGNRLYTIAPFAESGGTILIYDDNKDDVGYGRVHGDFGALGQRMGQLSRGDFFLDFRQTGITAGNDPMFVKPQPLWVEGTRWSLAVARDFDGIIWIRTVHSPDFPFVKRIAFSSLHYITELEVLGAVIVLGVIFLIVRSVRRRRRLRAA